MLFTVGIQTTRKMKLVLKHGHKSGVTLDATFRTNDKKFNLSFYNIIFHHHLVIVKLLYVLKYSM